MKSNVTLQLGLISVPVNVETAIEGKQEVSLNTLCTGLADAEHAPARVRQDLKCPSCNNTDKASFRKGKDNKDGTYALIDAAEIEAAGPDASVKNGLALTVHPKEDLANSLPGGKVYYLSPGKTAGKVYSLLVNVLKQKSDYGFVCEFAVRSVSALYRIGLAGDVITATELAWPEAVKPRPQVSPEYDENMLPLALQFVETLATPFDAEVYRDKRTAMLQEIIAKSEAVQGADVEAEPGKASKPSAGPTLDLAAQLAAAVEAATAPVKAKKAPAKKAAAKKVPVTA